MVSVDHFTRSVDLAPVRNITTSSIAEALVIHVLCSYTTPGILLNYNGEESSNSIFAQDCIQYRTENFTIAYYLSLNSMVERAKRIILDASPFVVNSLFENREVWILEISASINISSNEETLDTFHTGGIYSW